MHVIVGLRAMDVLGEVSSENFYDDENEGGLIRVQEDSELPTGWQVVPHSAESTAPRQSMFSWMASAVYYFLPSYLTAKDTTLPVAKADFDQAALDAAESPELPEIQEENALELSFDPSDNKSLEEFRKDILQGENVPSVYYNDHRQDADTSPDLSHSSVEYLFQPISYEETVIFKKIYSWEIESANYYQSLAASLGRRGFTRYLFVLKKHFLESDGFGGRSEDGGYLNTLKIYSSRYAEISYQDLGKIFALYEGYFMELLNTRNIGLTSMPKKLFLVPLLRFKYVIELNLKLSRDQVYPADSVEQVLINMFVSIAIQSHILGSSMIRLYEREPLSLSMVMTSNSFEVPNTFGMTTYHKPVTPLAIPKRTRRAKSVQYFTDEEISQRIIMSEHRDTPVQEITVIITPHFLILTKVNDGLVLNKVKLPYFIIDRSSIYSISKVENDVYEEKRLFHIIIRMKGSVSYNFIGKHDALKTLEDDLLAFSRA